MFISSALGNQGGQWDFAVSGGAIGTINLGVFIPKATTILMFQPQALELITGGVGATISFDLLQNGVASPVLSIGALLGATPIADFLGGLVAPPFPAQGQLLTGFVIFGVAPLALNTEMQITMSIGVSPLTAGKIKFNMNYYINTF
jgi:hypothetical protein